MQDAPENNPDRRNGRPSGKTALMVAINVIATGILFFLTVDDNEPFIATHVRGLDGTQMDRHRGSNRVPAIHVDAREKARRARKRGLT